jgi:outer membrane protein assembly factor BamB
VAALDPTSGQALWTVGQVPQASGLQGSPQCFVTSPDAAFGGPPAPDGQPEDVVCTSAGGAVCTALSAPEDTVAPGSSGVSTGSCVQTDAIAQVLDVRTGRVLRTIDLAWSSPAATMVDGDLVVAGLDTHGRLGAARWRLSGTDPVWRYLGAPMGAGSTPTVVAHGSSVEVFIGSDSVNLDAATGTEMPADARVDQRRVTLPDGSAAVQESDGTGPEGLQVHVLRPDGSVVLTEPGVLQGPTVNDGSVPGLVLVMDVPTGRERAINASTGSELWSTTGYAFGPLVNGRLVAWTTGSSLRVLDAATGQVLWQRQIGALTAGPFVPVTDGYRILSLEDAGTRLVARSLATGDELWSMPWAAAERSVLTTTSSGGVLVASAGRVTALAP